MKKIRCEKCGHINMVSGLGRVKRDMPVENVFYHLRNSPSINAAVRKMGVSKPWLYDFLEKHGTTPKEVINGRSN